MSEDYMKYDGSVPEPPYATISDFMDQVAELEAQLTACAAGEWRFDVENAPKSGVIWVLAKSGEYRAVAFCPVHDCWIDDDYHIWQHNMDAWAVPNPPQVATQAFDVPEWQDNDSGGYVQ